MSNPLESQSASTGWRSDYQIGLDEGRRDIQTRITELEALSERLKQEAQIHAMEARTANATIHEIYQLITGATGEPANWHGAEPVREYIASMKAQLTDAQKDARHATLTQKIPNTVRHWG